MNRKHSGCLSEQIAKIWLIKNGYEVFENISQHGEIDLVAIDPTTLETILIDVTTMQTYINKNGEKSIHFPKNKVEKLPKIQVLLVDQSTNEVFFYKGE